MKTKRTRRQSSKEQTLNEAIQAADNEINKEEPLDGSAPERDAPAPGTRRRGRPPGSKTRPGPERAGPNKELASMLSAAHEGIFYGAASLMRRDISGVNLSKFAEPLGKTAAVAVETMTDGDMSELPPSVAWSIYGAIAIGFVAALLALPKLEAPAPVQETA